MDYFNDFIYSIEETLDTKRRRHLVGGILLSMSLLFGGLALTAMSIKEDEQNEE